MAFLFDYLIFDLNVFDIQGTIPADSLNPEIVLVLWQPRSAVVQNTGSTFSGQAGTAPVPILWQPRSVAVQNTGSTFSGQASTVSVPAEIKSMLAPTQYSTAAARPRNRKT